MSRRNWIKLYVDHCLRGSWFDELTDPAERFVWVGLLLLAGDNALDGKVCLTDRMGYTDEQIAELLKVDEKLLQSAMKKMVKYRKVSILGGNVIMINNWTRYQSEYQRQRRYRGGKVTTKSDHQMSSLDRDRDREEEEKTPEIKKSPSSSCAIEVVKEVLEYLNEKTGAKFKATTTASQKHIRARLKEGFTVEDLKAVVDKKVAAWKGRVWKRDDGSTALGDTYLRPATLFGSKFESYLNERPAADLFAFREDDEKEDP